MSRTILLTALLLATPACLSAQDRPGVEVGVRAGVSVLMNQGDAISFGVPGGGPSPFGPLLGGNSTVHAAFFPSDQVMLEPQLGLSILSISNGASETVTALGLTGLGAYLFDGAFTSSPYIGLSGSYFMVDTEGDSETDFALGGTVGYRFLPMENVALRIEGAYRRWFDFEVNEVTAAFILGILLP